MTKVNQSNVPNRGDGQIFENGKLEDAWGNAASFKESNKLIQEFIAGGPLKLPEEEKAFFTILPDNPNYIPLRERGQLIEPLEWEKDRENKSPRALRALAKIIDGGLCHRCGSCVVVGASDSQVPREPW